MALSFETRICSTFRSVSPSGALRRSLRGPYQRGAWLSAIQQSRRQVVRHSQIATPSALCGGWVHLSRARARTRLLGHIVATEPMSARARRAISEDVAQRRFEKSTDTDSAPLGDGTVVRKSRQRRAWRRKRLSVARLTTYLARRHTKRRSRPHACCDLRCADAVLRAACIDAERIVCTASALRH